MVTRNTGAKISWSKAKLNIVFQKFEKLMLSINGILFCKKGIYLEYQKCKVGPTKTNPHTVV